LPTTLPEFEPSKCSNVRNDEPSHIDKGKGRVTDRLETNPPLTQSPVRNKEREQDNAGDATNSNNKLEGQIGRLIMRRSGKMQIILGDLTFDVSNFYIRYFIFYYVYI
jgi:hypothetical protein